MAMLAAGYAPAFGVYFDAGAGVMQPAAKAANLNMFRYVYEDVKITDSGTAEFGFRSGVLAFIPFPMYIVSDVSWNRGEWNRENVYLHMFAGTGVIVYPLSFAQIGFSVGYGWIGGGTNMPRYLYGGGGFNCNVSIAADVGRGLNGVVMGVKYAYAGNIYKDVLSERNNGLGLFARYARRFKAPVFR